MARPDAKHDATNAIRLLEAEGIDFVRHSFDPEAPNGMEIAKMLGQDPTRVFKTLVTMGKEQVGRPRGHYVFVVPVCAELDLKKAAAAVGEKSVEMLKSKDLLGLTGYVHGGCSPIGMKKPFPTVVDETAQMHERILFSAGRRGEMVELSPDDLLKIVPYAFADVIRL